MGLSGLPRGRGGAGGAGQALPEQVMRLADQHFPVERAQHADAAANPPRNSLRPSLMLCALPDLAL